MAGTPIKIPGKNTRDSSKSAVLARKILKRPRGRPLKPKCSKIKSNISQSLSTVPRKSKVRTMENIKSKRKMSHLEKLPTELLETIFLYCLNLSLPACSPVIGGKLSSETIYTKTIIAAFDPTWAEWYGSLCPVLRTAHVGTGDNYTHRDDFQSAVLRRRWARLPVLLRSQDQWVRKYGQERKFPVTITQSLCDENHPFGIESGIEFVDPKTVSASELLENDFARYRYVFERMQESDFATRHRYIETLNRMRKYMNLAKSTEIPHTLLMGPWDEKAVKFLFWLVMGGASIGWFTSTSGEAAIIGYKRAVRESRIEVMHLLLFAGVENKVDRDIIKYTLENTDAGRHFPTILSMICFTFSPLSLKEKHEEIYQFKDSPEHEKETEKLMLIEEFEDCAPILI